MKRGKTQATKSWVFLFLHLIGRKSGASLLGQSQNKVKWNQNNPGLLSTSNTEFALTYKHTTAA